MYFESFKEFNPCTKQINTFSIEKVKESMEDKYNWSFLPSAALDIINRYSLKTVEIADMLYKYKYIEPEEIASIMTYATGVPFRYINPLLVSLTKMIKTNMDILAFQGEKGIDSVIYVNAEKLYSEAQINIEVPGKITDIYYILPTNYNAIVNSSESEKWDYYIMFGRYMFYCLENKASDIHFEVIHDNKEVKYRAVCRIGPDREECTLFDQDESINKDLIRETIQKRSSNQQALLDLDAGLGVVANIPDVFSDGKLEVRFTVEKVYEGYYCVCRLQETKTVSLSLDELGFDKEIVKILREVTQRPSGLTIISGKIRTGKNTTMASLGADIINRTSKPALMSLDNPIEILGSYPQIDYKGEISLLNAGIKLAKKLDLDYVMLNEIPSADVAFAVRELVNSSIHTLTTWHMNRIWHLPHKLYEYFGESYRDLISQMNLICNQRLYKRQCPYCQEEVHRVNHEADLRIHDFFIKNNLYSSLVSQGCEHCDYTGYLKGTIVVLPEILVFTQNLILELFKANRPYQMELVLMEAMKGSKFSLEIQLCYALQEGRLSPKDILSIV